jgi:hypothetical protein
MEGVNLASTLVEPAARETSRGDDRSATEPPVAARAPLRSYLRRAAAGRDAELDVAGRGRAK